jgi:hypothetical protein
MKENDSMFSHPIQKKAYDAVAAALPFAIDPAKVTVEPGVSYLPSPIKLHDYAVGVMAAFGSVVLNEHGRQGEFFRRRLGHEANPIRGDRHRE